MPNIFDANGLQVDTLSELTTALQTDFKAIYGSDINLDQNSPDGQLIGIFAQSIIDQLELLVEINNSFNPDTAVGVLLDQRCTINNIQRAGGTFTIINLDITCDRTLTLQGLDANFNNINGTGYTVQDNAGNLFILVDTVTITIGTSSLEFRAQKIGQVNTTINTITTQTTVVLGITAVNNPNAPLSVGQNQETDAQLRIRRQQSVANATTGYLNGILGNVLSLIGVTSAKIYENVTGSTDADGIPAHGMWLIVEGGANTDIANVIYERKSYGANMKGAVTVDIPTASGATFTAKFDRPTSENLYIKFNIQPTIAGQTFNDAAIKTYIVANLIYGIGQSANIYQVGLVAKAAIDVTSGGGIPTEVLISIDGSTWVDFLNTATKDKEWALSTARIAITDL